MVGHLNRHIQDLNSVASNPYSILRVLGGWGNINGPGLVMFRSMIAGTTTAAMFSIELAMFSATLTGTAALPFIIGSSIGFAFGSWRWYAVSMSEALIRLDAYPALLRLHLMSKFPSKFRNWPASSFRAERFKDSAVLKSMLIAAWLTARPALEDIEGKKEAAIVEEYTRDSPEFQALEAGEEKAD